MRRRSMVLIAAALGISLAAAIAYVVEPTPPASGPATVAAPTPAAAPVQSVEATPTPEPASTPAAATPPETLAGIVRSRLDGAGVAGAELRFRCAGTPRAVKSGPDGKFTLEGGATCAVESITARGFVPFDPTRASRARVKAELAYWLDPLGGYTVVVLGEDQRPLVGARVQVWKRDGDAGDGRTTDRGGEARVRAAAGDSVVASAPGYLDRAARAPRSATRIELVLHRAAAVIEGRVVDPDGRGVALAKVSADTSPPDSSERGDPRCEGAPTAPDGRFSLSCPVDGSFTVRAAHPSFEAEAAGAVHTGTRDLVVKLRKGPGIKGCVVRATGEPGARAKVVANREGEKAPRTATADASGCFAIPNLEQVDEYKLTATLEGLTATVDSIPPGSDDVLIELPEEARMRGRVKEAGTGAPVTSFVIRVVRHGGGSAETVSAASFLDAGGEFEVAGLGPGEYALWATAEGYLPATSGRISIAGPPGPGGAVELVLEKSRCVAGAVIDDESGRPIAGAMVDPRGVGRNGPPGEAALGGDTDASGEFRVCTLSGERQSLFVSAEGYTSRLVSGVEAGDAAPRRVVRLRKANGGGFEYAGVGMRLDGNQTGRLLVHSVFPESPAARASIAAGDEVLSIDGQTFDAKDGVSRAVERILGEEGTPVRIGLRRAATGTQVELTITRERIQPPS